MLVLLDQGTPVPLRSFLKGHTVKTAAQQRWSALANGDLLRMLEILLRAGWRGAKPCDLGKHSAESGKLVHAQGE